MRYMHYDSPLMHFNYTTPMNKHLTTWYFLMQGANWVLPFIVDSVAMVVIIVVIYRKYVPPPVVLMLLMMTAYYPKADPPKYI